ncbi:Alcohol dehydrogenase [Acidisarcina polymorpha]|uniref:Alcohol dehydrogenase n=1 Tax=Acidisarcina polymorpha TaxID=2211140 RepID=A0A2Z5GA39_9BACT|nr:alcohol dehydrogenase catalytic domain-containing protein [Acidisarcina polymorpha]AXC15780.1 Alcohol dehydrogenase [Acidisarcina polymorpha]
MKAVQMDEVLKPMAVRDVSIPEIGDEDALVRVTASGICRTDWHLWNGDWGWIGVKLSLPLVLGHEIGGVVERVGSRVDGLTVGTRVCVPFNMACGHCPYCVRGLQNDCDNYMWPMLTQGSGGFAQYVRVPKAQLNCVTLPANVTEKDAAALGCRYMTAYRAVRTRADLHAGETVAVTGVGGVGRSAVEIAVALGGQVIAIDTKDSALEAAKKLGAVEVINSEGLTPKQVGERVKALTGGTGVDVGIDAIGGSNATLSTLQSIAKYGRLVVAGLTSQEDKGEVTIPIDQIVAQELSVIGTLGNPQSDYPDLLRLVNSGKLAPSRHIESEVRLEDVQAVFDRMPKFQTNGFVVITQLN